ncbi:MAG: SDR family NAD(P)-dependent oxidoreductase, partial [Desulfobacteraceae bacterium]|nr:SDR family NAD(P)-dependent oxidoreductase [Desulfobacteraceae bacterium]
MLKPVWKEKAVDSEQKVPEYTEHRVFLCGLNQKNQTLQDQMPEAIFVNLESNQKTLKKRFEDYSLELFANIQKILQEKPKGNVLLQVLVPDKGPKQVFSGLSGLLKTARLENPKILGQVIAVREEASVEDVLAKLRDNSKSPEDEQIRYEEAKRLVASFEEVAGLAKGQNIPWKEGGVYLITGGAGGLGLIFAKEIAEKTKNATLILTGRSELNEEKRAKLEKLEALGVKVEYRAVDVCDKKAVEGLIGEIKKDFGNLNGMIHSAGVIKDNFILKKNNEEFKAVLAPKVEGVVNLDQAAKELDHLDFFVLFSSGAGVMGNVGQADYSTANAFMDAFAKYRNPLPGSKRTGQTLSINWPLWKEGGMGVDEATEKMMKAGMGMAAMETSSGIEAFYQGLSSKESQVMVMEGLLKRMKQKLLLMPQKISKPKTTAAFAETPSGIDAGHLFDKIQQMLLQAVCKLLKLRIEDLDVDAELSEYGFDSITLTDFANKMNQEYKLELTPTVFFEYPTIESFARYLSEEHQAVFAEKFAVRMQSQKGEAPKVEFEEGGEKPRLRSRFAKTMISSVSESKVSEPVAIVGMSGQFPMAGNIEE